jgi:serine protease AprX
MKGLNMKKLLLTLLIAIVADLAIAETPPLKIAPTEPRISPNFEDGLRAAPSVQLFKVWIFFTDKEIFDNVALKAAVDNLGGSFSKRALARRTNRSNNPDFDFYDIPVSRNYIGALESAGVTIIYASRWLNAVAVEADYQKILDITGLSFVAKVSPVARFVREPLPQETQNTTGVPIEDSSFYGYSFTQLDQINVPLMHKLGYSGKGVLIALFDTGFRLNLPVFDTLNTHLVAAYDFINDDETVGDSTPSIAQLRHGTMTLSVCGGFEPDSLIGPAYGADFIMAKTEIENEEIEAEEDNWVAAAEWADSLGADIISSSVGYYQWYTYSDLDGITAAVTIAADIAVSRGISVFNAAGNTRSCGSPSPSCFYYITPPADGFDVMAIGAVNSLNQIADFSSAGPTYDGRIKPDLVAMGVSAFVANYTGIYGYANGTSFATPLIAGAAALILQAHPEWTPESLKTAMVLSGDNHSHPNNLYGSGLPDAFEATKLLWINKIDPIKMTIGDSVDLEVTVEVMADSIAHLQDSVPVINAYNLPDSTEFTDNHNGTATFRYKATAGDIGYRQILITAAIGLASASLGVDLTVFGQTAIIAGPNPFSDSLTIFLGAQSGRPLEISVHSANGEKVWENFSDNYNDTRATVTWPGVNARGKRVASGVYYIIVKTEKSEAKLKVFKK